MVLLQVDLQDGFKDDMVIINVNNKQAFHKDKVNTKLIIGYADSFKIDVPAGSVTIMLALSSRGLAKTFSFKISEQAFVAFSLQDNHVNCQTKNAVCLFLTSVPDELTLAECRRSPSEIVPKYERKTGASN